MPVAKYSDSEFIRRWKDARERGIGARQLAAEMGTDHRNMMRRRRRIEQDHGPLRALPHGNLNINYDSHAYHLDHEYTAVIFSDAHWHPNVDSPATWVMLEVLQDIEPELVIANGDLLDGWTISRHPRIGWDEGPTVKEELESVIAWMGMVEEASPESDRFWPIGNHDIRFDTYLSTNAAQYEGIHGCRLSDHFPNWEHICSITLNDDVVVKHRYKGGVNAARANALNAGISMVTGHTHKLRVVPVTDYNGTRYGVETGTLLDCNGPQMLYAEHNPLDMQQGFIVCEMTSHGPRFEPVEVINGKARFRGKTYG